MILTQHDFTGPFESTVEASKTISLEINQGFFLLILIVGLLSFLLVYFGSMFGKYRALKSLEDNKNLSINRIYYNISALLNYAITKHGSSRKEIIREIKDEVEFYLGSVLAFHDLHFKSFEELKNALAESDPEKSNKKSGGTEIELGADQDRLNHAMWKAVHEFKDEWSHPDTKRAIEAAQDRINWLIEYGFNSAAIDETATNSSQMTHKSKSQSVNPFAKLWAWGSEPAFGKPKPSYRAGVPAPPIPPDVSTESTSNSTKKGELPKHKKSFLS
jgi:hypothetical protein